MCGFTLTVQVETVIAVTAAVGAPVVVVEQRTIIPPPLALRGDSRLTLSVFYSTDESVFL